MRPSSLQDSVQHDAAARHSVVSTQREPGEQTFAYSHGAPTLGRSGMRGTHDHCVSNSDGRHA